MNTNSGIDYYRQVQEWLNRVMVVPIMENIVARCQQEFKGKIPPIAEKEKRGKRVKIPPSEIYVQELTTNAGNNSNNS